MGKRKSIGVHASWLILLMIVTFEVREAEGFGCVGDCPSECVKYFHKPWLQCFVFCALRCMPSTGGDAGSLADRSFKVWSEPPSPSPLPSKLPRKGLHHQS